jgi:hypothetical protein
MTQPLPDPFRLTTKELFRAGTVLYGHHWKRDLAFELKMHQRTVGRWATGKQRPPRTLRARLIELCHARRDALLVVARDISPHKMQRLDSAKTEA